MDDFDPVGCRFARISWVKAGKGRREVAKEYGSSAAKQAVDATFAYMASHHKKTLAEILHPVRTLLEACNDFVLF